MDNKVQVFAFHGEEVRGITIDGEPWVAGKDVAARLGYKDTVNALKVHVDEEDKRGWRITTPGGEQEMTVINESGLYALVFGSKLPAAKEFKRWVTSEVLPALRRDGTYTVKGRRADPEVLRLRAMRLEILKANSDTRKARELRNIIESNADMGGEAKQVLVREIVRLCTGRDYPDLMADEPPARQEPEPAAPAEVATSPAPQRTYERKMFTATEVAEAIGAWMSNRKVMSSARRWGIVAPGGEGNEYGRWKVIRIPHSNREREQWYFNDEGRLLMIKRLGGN